MIIDGHGHSSGNYLTSESIKHYLTLNSVDYVILVPGQPNSKTTYKFKDKTELFPNKDFISGTNKIIKVVTGLTRSKKHISNGNENIFNMRKENNCIKQFYWALRTESIDSIETKHSRMSFQGIKIHQGWENIKLNSEWFLGLCDWLIQKDLPLFIHLYSLKDILNIKKLIFDNPKLKIIIAHCYGLEELLELDTRKLNNTFFDLSNNYFISRLRINNGLKKIGSTKFTLGSDTPYGEDALKLTIDRINSLSITQTEKENILGNNLQQLLNI
jgi:uncharacterized protein